MLSERRTFFKRMAQVVFGGLVGYFALPNLISSTEFNAYAGPTLGPKQTRLLLASKNLMNKSGILRAMSIFQYGNDGEIESDWSVNIPPEDQINDAMDALSQRVISMVAQS
jgi:hypothetical protein